jgi:hypothetical protein
MLPSREGQDPCRHLRIGAMIPAFAGMTVKVEEKTVPEQENSAYPAIFARQKGTQVA